MISDMLKDLVFPITVEDCHFLNTFTCNALEGPQELETAGMYF